MRLLITPQNISTTSYMDIAAMRCFGSGFVNGVFFAYIGRYLIRLAHLQMVNKRKRCVLPSWDACIGES